MVLLLNVLSINNCKKPATGKNAACRHNLPSWISVRSKDTEYQIHVIRNSSIRN